AELCGRSVAVVRTTAQASAAASRSARCTAAGKAALRIAKFADPDAAGAAVAGGRAQVAMTDSAAAARLVKQSPGRLDAPGAAFGRTPRAIATAGTNVEAGELADALETLIGDGSYDAILARWGAQADAIAKPRITGRPG